MFRQIPLIRFCSMVALSLAAMIVAAPSALAACSCMCVDGAPYNVCTGFVSTQEQTAECDLLECPTVTDPPAETSGDGTTVEEPVAAIDPPHPGLECERRSVYRPDLGQYKKYKVCKPSADAEHRSNHENHGRNAEAWTARHERMQARWETQMARYRDRGRHHDDDEG
jgi:hypothetical protein